MDFLVPAPQGSPLICRECTGIQNWVGQHWIGDHVQKDHGLTLTQYLTRHPDAHTCSPELMARYEAGVTQERKAAQPEGLSLSFAGVSFPVYPYVPSGACLPMPEHYRVPTKGNLARDVQDVAVALKRNRSVWVWGAPGTGKDAVFSALCAMTRRPSLLFSIIQGADITSWKYTRAFDARGTTWEEGELLKALRDGYRDGRGNRIPYLIVFSDFDRATRAQAEELRQVLDSIQGRITGPTGEVWPVLPGTTIVATANSSGAGDTTGRCISANPIDASILDRFERKVHFHSMDPVDEKIILKAKFSVLSIKYPSAIDVMMNATTAVREAVEREEVYCEWSHRSVCAWAGAVEDLLETLPNSGKAINPLIGRAARVVIDGLPDLDTQENVRRVMDPHVPGGMLDSGKGPGGLGAPLSVPRG